MSTRTRERLARLSVAVVAVATLAAGAGTPAYGAGTLPAQSGWRVLATSARGVVVDEKLIDVQGHIFSAVRFRAGAVAFGFHVGSEDPPGAASLVPASAKPAISAAELAVGVIGAFNGGYKVKANAGGIWVAGRAYAPMKPGLATIEINASGQISIGVWGHGMPNAYGVVYRQNLSLIVSGGQRTAAANLPWYDWGGVINNQPLQPRTGLGVDRQGNVIYVATMSGVSPNELGAAMVRSGVVTGMVLDMNPYWPSLGVATKAIHSRAGAFSTGLAGQEANPNHYFAGWIRDFFVVMATPGRKSCAVRFSAAGAGPSSVGKGCSH